MQEQELTTQIARAGHDHRNAQDGRIACVSTGDQSDTQLLFDQGQDSGAARGGQSLPVQAPLSGTRCTAAEQFSMSPLCNLRDAVKLSWEYTAGAQCLEMVRARKNEMKILNSRCPCVKPTIVSLKKRQEGLRAKLEPLADITELPDFFGAS